MFPEELSPALWLKKLEQQIQDDHSHDVEKGRGDMAEQMTFSWSIESLLASVQGDLISTLGSIESVRFSSVSTDSRTLQAGALYVAIKGENFDGHQFIQQAVQQGAVAVLVSEYVDCIVPGVLVDDTRLALGQFARWHRLQMPLKKCIAVTGSNGKTTTKALLQAIFSKVGNTLATVGNLNNDLGVPRTLLNLRPEHEYAIIEMGANHRQEIGYLTQLALPDIALITNASGAHLEGFGSLQGVIETKGEIFLGLNQRPKAQPGVAVINTDSAGYADWLERLKARHISQVWSFGSAADATVRLTEFSSDAHGIDFKLQVSQQSYAVRMPILGRHNAMNAAACVAVALSAELRWPQIQPGLVEFEGVAGRLQKKSLKAGWLIDDSYNANPESVKAGIDALVALPGLSVLCLGAMAELGANSIESHQQIAEYAKTQGVDYLLVYGADAKPMPAVFGENSTWFTEHQSLAEAVKKIIAGHSPVNVLVKGSRSAKMELVAQALI